MNNQKGRKSLAVLDDETLNRVGDALAPEKMPIQRKKAVFSKIMTKIEQREQGREPDFITVRASKGKWEHLMPKVDKKVLFVDIERKTEAYLLRLQPGAELPRHSHDSDEYCMVLEGDVMFDDIELHEGDFHLARQGSWHSMARSSSGALLYLESSIY